MPFPLPSTTPTPHTYYKIIGTLSPTTIPLIMLHGGPGAGHSDLLPIGPALAAASTPVIYYDQIGCGRSSHLREMAHDPTFWTLDLFRTQLDALVDHLRLRENGFHILGHSWGGMLAGTYAAGRPRGLRRLVVANAPASAALYAGEARRLLEALGGKEVVRQADEGRFKAAEYVAACELFVEKHFCRLEVWPEILAETRRCFDECAMFDVM